MRSWPIQNKEDLDKTKGNLTEWVEIMFLETFLIISQSLLKVRQNRNDFLKLTFPPKTYKGIKFYYYEGGALYLIFLSQSQS
mgnify:CR=1 FL=1